MIVTMNQKILGFTGGSVVKNPPANAGDTGSILGSERSPAEGNGNPMDRGAWWLHYVALQKSQRQLSN